MIKRAQGKRFFFLYQIASIAEASKNIQKGAGSRHKKMIACLTVKKNFILPHKAAGAIGISAAAGRMNSPNHHFHPSGR